MKYEELVRQCKKERKIVQSARQSQKHGKKCKYSSEQIRLAEKHKAQNKLNDFCNHTLLRAINGVLCAICSVVNLALLPFTGVPSKAIVVIGFCLLVTAEVVIILIDKVIKRKMNKHRRWVDCFGKFADDTTFLTIMITAMGYMKEAIGGAEFVFVYCLLLLLFFLFAIYDAALPLIKHQDVDEYGEFR